ncbi:hypothetical protein UA75_26045 [Actinoalloteichus sp. GBA129-24]|uniref:Uncharacterized protein n=1 Tax=Actinoalloteichus fjordicus TaxID=1612552 RepID=A0AAC9LHN8_9PSEU|nr:hypothetical protein UA74_25465 [Actinoalloteichus fjordicus]APU23182.1 hypothetical protein UA75_26045 [Actinoalloteichus sp. GBA129-24]
MLPRWQELTLLVQRASDRPRWQQVQAVIISLWSGAWIVGQIGPPDTRLSPLDVPGRALETVGVDVRDALHSAGEFLAEPQRRTVLLLCAWVAGLLWAATTEHAQYTALAGWLLVMVAAEGLGYHQAIYRAVLALVGLVVLLYLCSLPLRRVPMNRRPRLLPRDVLSAGATAGALSGIVPLLAIGMLTTRVCRPYLTRPPALVGEVLSPIRPESTRAGGPARSSAGPAFDRSEQSDQRSRSEQQEQGGPARPEIDIPDQPGAEHDVADPARRTD